MQFHAPGGFQIMWEALQRPRGTPSQGLVVPEPTLTKLLR